MSGKEAQHQVTRDSQRDWHRNIVSLRKSVDVFADLVDDERHMAVLIEHEMSTKLATREPAIVTRPFEDADLYDAIAAAIEWPFMHPWRSRFSDGSFGVWYGAESVETSVRETVHHFRKGTLASAVAAQSRVPIVQERRVHLIRCKGLLVDLRALAREDKSLLDPDDYTICQLLGAELKNAGMPGVITISARHANAEVVGVFTPQVLMDPRMVCYLTYTLFAESGRVAVERARGEILYELEPA